MLLIKSPKIWVSMRAITFCLCVLWKACITWHFWATNRKLTFSWKITPQGAIPPLKSLGPRKLEWNFMHSIFQIISVIDGWVISCELAFRWMSLDLTDDKSTLDQVMAWCRQATSHYLSQCWPRSLSPYGVTRPQWFNSCGAEFILGNIKTYLHFLSFIDTEMAEVRGQR